ncbi:MAG: late competence development ComFB family protein [Desertifilum sp. SIO1I2]|nr:late competence development ComFB family protein [Desertifilum sp. SIO1I2]
MSKKLLNLTLPIVLEEIENVLAAYPKYPYQQAFSVSELRQDLVAYVLSRVPNKYAAVEETEPFVYQMGSSVYSSKQMLDIENCIHIGIQDILHVYHQTASRLARSLSTSHLAS